MESSLYSGDTMNQLNCEQTQALGYISNTGKTFCGVWLLAKPNTNIVLWSMQPASGQWPSDLCVILADNSVRSNKTGRGHFYECLLHGLMDWLALHAELCPLTGCQRSIIYQANTKMRATNQFTADSVDYFHLQLEWHLTLKYIQNNPNAPLLQTSVLTKHFHFIFWTNPVLGQDFH